MPSGDDSVVFEDARQHQRATRSRAAVAQRPLPNLPIWAARTGQWTYRILVSVRKANERLSIGGSGYYRTSNTDLVTGYLTFLRMAALPVFVATAHE